MDWGIAIYMLLLMVAHHRIDYTVVLGTVCGVIDIGLVHGRMEHRKPAYSIDTVVAGCASNVQNLQPQASSV